MHQPRMRREDRGNRNIRITIGLGPKQRNCTRRIRHLRRRMMRQLKGSRSSSIRMSLSFDYHSHYYYF